MKCAVCEVELLAWERPQTMTLGGTQYRVTALCDRCARLNTTRGGSPESLERLVKGKLDEEEVARVRAATLLPWESE
jgi:hypothetical protein